MICHYSGKQSRHHKTSSRCFYGKCYTCGNSSANHTCEFKKIKVCTGHCYKCWLPQQIRTTNLNSSRTHIHGRPCKWSTESFKDLDVDLIAPYCIIKVVDDPNLRAQFIAEYNIDIPTNADGKNTLTLMLFQESTVNKMKWVEVIFLWNCSLIFNL
jgi:hypothetical protein